MPIVVIDLKRDPLDGRERPAEGEVVDRPIGGRFVRRVPSDCLWDLFFVQSPNRHKVEYGLAAGEASSDTDEIRSICCYKVTLRLDQAQCSGWGERLETLLQKEIGQLIVGQGRLSFRPGGVD